MWFLNVFGGQRPSQTAFGVAKKALKRHLEELKEKVSKNGPKIYIFVGLILEPFWGPFWGQK